MTPDEETSSNQGGLVEGKQEDHDDNDDLKGVLLQGLYLLPKTIGLKDIEVVPERG